MGLIDPYLLTIVISLAAATSVFLVLIYRLFPIRR